MFIMSDPEGERERHGVAGLGIMRGLRASPRVIQPRITKRRSRSAKRKQIRTNQAWAFLHLGEDAREGSQQIRGAGEVAVVRPVLARVLPEAFGGIELRRVGRQLMHVQPVAVGSEPGPRVCVLVIGGVVLNQQRSLAAIPARQRQSEMGVSTLWSCIGSTACLAGLPIALSC